MKRSHIIFVLTSLSVIAGYAQSPQFSIFDSFETLPKTGEGYVIVHQSSAIKRLVGTRIDSENVDVSSGKPQLITRGYRIQVYSGNNPRSSRTEAEQLEKKIKELFPDINTYIRYSAPFWKLNVGNYLTWEEAAITRRELWKIFPQRKNEIYPIEDDIQLPLD